MRHLFAKKFYSSVQTTEQSKQSPNVARGLLVFYFLGNVLRILFSVFHILLKGGGYYMEEFVWTVKESFTFPLFGVVKGSEMLRVTPQWEEIHSDSSVRLVGVYHIAAKMTFDFGVVDGLVDNSVAIHDLDLEGSNGYFEYAVPFDVDLPDQVENPQMAVRNIRTAFENGNCAISWDVVCNYVKQEVKIENPKPVKKVAKVQKKIENPFVTENPFANENPILENKITEETVAKSDIVEELQEEANILEENKSEQKRTVTHAPMIWDLTENYTVMHVTSNNIVRK